MVDKTKQKILDAALKEFAQKGYNGTTAMAIAERVGVNELTVFRKFKTKRNLFNSVIDYNTEKFKREYFSAMTDEEFDNPELFLRITIRKIAKLTEDNIEYIRLTLFENIGEHEPLEEVIPHLAGHIAKNIQNEKIDVFSFTLTITGAFIMLSNNKYLGRVTVDHEIMVEMLINNFVQCI